MQPVEGYAQGKPDVAGEAAASATTSVKSIVDPSGGARPEQPQGVPLSDLLRPPPMFNRIEGVRLPEVDKTRANPTRLPSPVTAGKDTLLPNEPARSGKKPVPNSLRLEAAEPESNREAGQEPKPVSPQTNTKRD